jgi:hypothetical protein
MDTNEFCTGFFSYALLGLVGSFLVGAVGSHRDAARVQLRMFHVALALRFLMSVVLYSTSLHAKVVGDADDSGWYGAVGFVEEVDQAGLGAFGLPAAYMGVFERVNRGYFYLVGVYFCLTRLISQLSAAALGGFCGALTAVVAYRMARLLFSERVARRTGWWVCFFPGMIIWSAQSVKEPLVILFEAAALYACLRLRRDRASARHIILCGVSLFLLLTLRFYAAYIAGAVILVSLTLPQVARRKTTVIPALWTALVLGATLYLLSENVRKHADIFERQGNLKAAGEFRDAVSQGPVGAGSGVRVEYDLGTGQGLAMSVLVGAMNLLLAPFPWQMFGASFRMLMVYPENLFWWYLVFAGLIPGFVNLARTRLNDILPVLLFVLGLGFIYCVMFGNIGLIYRQRAQLLPYLLAVSAYGRELRRSRRRPPAPAAVVPPVADRPPTAEVPRWGP